MQFMKKSDSDDSGFGLTQGFLNDKLRRKTCRVPTCIENHQKHYCLKCKALDADHVASKCPDVYGDYFNQDKHKMYSGEIKHNYYENQFNMKRVYPSQNKLKVYENLYAGFSGLNNNYDQIGQVRKCRVLNCKQIHYRHYCKNCQNPDSNHFSSCCTFSSKNCQKEKEKRKNVNKSQNMNKIEYQRQNIDKYLHKIGQQRLKERP